MEHKKRKRESSAVSLTKTENLKFQTELDYSILKFIR